MPTADAASVVETDGFVRRVGGTTPEGTWLEGTRRVGFRDGAGLVGWAEVMRDDLESGLLGLDAGRRALVMSPRARFGGMVMREWGEKRGEGEGAPRCGVGSGCGGSRGVVAANGREVRCRGMVLVRVEEGRKRVSDDERGRERARRRE